MEIYRFSDQKRGNFSQREAVSSNGICIEHFSSRTASEIRLLGWNVPAHELHTIPEHWLSYPEPDASLQYLLGMLYIAFTIVALIGNGLVIWVFTW